MLSSRDDDDDNHLCIKCNATIIGLDNYVKHRKERCGKLKTDVPKSDLPPIDPLEPSYSLGADVFFQSLELQSSVKKTNSLARLTPPIPTTKASLDRKHTLVMPSTSRDIPRMSPLETNLRGEDWIGGHSLRIGVNEDNQTKLINAVASISGTVKKDIPTSSYSITYDYKGDEDSEVSEESEDEDDDDQVIGGKWKPPLNYTGGKWRPVSPEHEEWEQENADGKWQTIMHDENDEDYDAPPPDHTKGKWVPGANDKTQIMQTTIQTKGSVQYWCGPCNRRLGSRAIYDKHLKSKLHMKNVLPEHELEFSGHLEPMKNITTKRITRPSIFLNENIYSQLKRKKSKKHAGTINVKISTKKRKRNPYFVNCPGCKSRVRQHLMGKHLISHYHFRKTTNINTSDYQQLIIDNIEAVVHQSPFQCSPCKFYTNWLSTFMQHWFSKEHELKMADTDGKLWCSFCKFNCDSTQDMLQHMSGPDHSEVVAVINRSMPIIIRKKTIIKCETCDKEFRYNIEMKRHNQETGHGLSHTATDNYQEIHKCKHCSARFKSSLSLAAHLKSKHKQRAFLCLVCEKSFSSSEESKRHRQTSEHSIKRRELLKEKGATTTELRKKCPYCPQNVILSNILMLKEHIRRMHPHIRKRCPKCGMAFIFSQEVTRHIRANACEFNSSTQTESHNFWSCSQCLFTTDSQAECFFHEVLHTMPKKVTINTKTGAKVVQKYTCPLCPRSYRKASLRVHLRQHTSERPFICSQCGANFTRQTSLVSHVKREHGPGAKAKSSKLQTIVEKIEDLECKKCKEKFKTKSVLNRHEAGCISSPGGPHRCPHDQCIFVTNNLTTLAKHRRTHGERIKHHECHLCPFKSDQASHLKRHMLCHQGVKPYACPHCSFTSGSLKESRTDVQFHLAALRGDCDRLRQLLDTGKVHIDSRDRDGTTPLILSAAMGHTECVRELLAQGADPACCRTTGTSALFFAAQGGFLDVACLLLDAGANIDAPSLDGGTPLFVACQCGHLPVVNELIRRGANVNSCMKDKATPLFIAAQNGHSEACEALAAAGARVDAARADRATPLWIAAQCGHAPAAAALLRAGASADAVRQDGATPLFKAAHKGHAAVVAELLKHNPNLGLLPNGQTALHGAAMFGQLSCVRLLARRSGTLVRNAAGLTAAQAAAAARRPDVAAYLASLAAGPSAPSGPPRSG